MATADTVIDNASQTAEFLAAFKDRAADIRTHENAGPVHRLEVAR